MGDQNVFCKCGHELRFHSAVIPYCLAHVREGERNACGELPDPQMPHTCACKMFKPRSEWGEVLKEIGGANG